MLSQLAVGDIEQHPHPQLTFGVAGHHRGAPQKPLHLAVGQHDPELAAQRPGRLSQLVKVKLKQMNIVRMAVAGHDLGVLHHRLRIQPVKITNARTHKTVGSSPLPIEVEHIHHAWNLAGDQPQLFFAAAQRVLDAHVLGDVFHRAFVIQGLALGIAHHMGMSPDPYSFPCTVAVNLIQHAANKAVALKHLPKLLALARVHVPLVLNILHVAQQLGLLGISVHRDQGRIGAQEQPGRTDAVGAYRQEIEKRR